VIQEDRNVTRTDRVFLKREIAIIQTLDHPFIGKVFSVDFEGEGCVIIQEYLPHGTMLEMIMRDGALADNQIRYYLVQLVAAVDYLHRVKKVAHRDLKLENIMMDNLDNIRLIDFGLSHAFTDSDNAFTTPCGSPPYLAPEIITEGRYTQAADIWSLGIVLYALATANLPFYNDNLTTLCRQIISCQVHYPMSLNEDLQDLLQRMLCRDPAVRITIEEIKEHPYFPSQEYASSIALLKQLFRFDFETNEVFDETLPLDDVVLDMLAAKGIDCTDLSSMPANHQKSEAALLYQILLRQEQGERMNRILRMGKGIRLGPAQPGSSPALRPPHPHLTPIVFGRQGKNPSFISTRHTPEQRLFRREPTPAIRAGPRPAPDGGTRRKRAPVLPPLPVTRRRQLAEPDDIET
jgi:serine/threonine protein kinase